MIGERLSCMILKTVEIKLLEIKTMLKTGGGSRQQGEGAREELAL